MSKDKYCGNCRNFSGEDIFGNGICLHTDDELHCTTSICQYYEPNIEGWTEITPDNVDSIYDEVIKRVIVTDGNEYKPVLDWHCGLSTMAKCGGYYYYILPELKIE